MAKQTKPQDLLNLTGEIKGIFTEEKDLDLKLDMFRARTIIISKGSKDSPPEILMSQKKDRNCLDSLTTVSFFKIENNFKEDIYTNGAGILEITPLAQTIDVVKICENLKGFCKEEIIYLLSKIFPGYAIEFKSGAKPFLIDTPMSISGKKYI